MKSMRRLGSIALVLALTGCAHYQFNDPKPVYEADYGYRYPPVAQTAGEDEIYVALAFSGGGTRAAALSYGVLEKLKNTPIRNASASLLDEVDVISSVSGGSFTSAYYGLFGDRLFTDFKDRFLYRDIEGELIGKLFNPYNWWRLMSPDFNRIDLAIELYDETVFERKTYRDLGSSGDAPFIAINATNLTTGSQFTFSQPEFDILGSDLSTLPVARAVASSSAFPFLLSPVSYRNFPASSGFELSRDMRNGLDDGYGGANPRRFLWAHNRAIYHRDKAGHPYVHMMDGGLSDNIGARYLADNFSRSSGFLFQRKSAIGELILIIVNAKTQPPETLDQDETPPDLLDVAFKTATVSMDNYSFETIAVVSDMLNVSARNARIILDCQAVIDRQCSSGFKLPQPGHRFNVTVVEINFLNLEDPDRRREMLSLPTSFKLSKAQVDALIRTGQELLEQSPAFEQVVRRLQ